MSRLLLALICLAAVPALAKPWNGIIPGASSSIDVVGKFGEPSKKLKVKNLDVLVYSGDKAIKGTTQAQFKVNPETKVVERIDVYPAPQLTPEAIERSYGGECGGEDATEPCYHRKEGEGKKVYFLYAKLGLAIFFKDEGKLVRSFTFLPEKP